MRLRAGGSILLFGLGLAAVPELPAQEGRSPGFGAMLAMTVSRFGGLDRGDYTRSRVWLTGGGYARFQLSPGFALQPELILVQKGAKLEQPGFASGITITYVEVPVLARVTVPIRREGLQITPHFYTGGSFGLKVRCRATFVSGVASSTLSCSDGGFPIKSTDVGVVFGAGVDLGRAMIGVRYVVGMTNVGGGDTNRDLKNRTLFLFAGWTLRAPR